MANITTRDPWHLLDQLQREMGLSPGLRDDETHVVGSNWSPAVDIKEEADRFVLLADIPGVSPSDIEISMDKGVLTIRGERKHERVEAEHGFHRSERRQGMFMRRFTLPDSVDADNITATSQDGVLKLVLPKTTPATPRKITVRTED